MTNLITLPSGEKISKKDLAKRLNIHVEVLRRRMRSSDNIHDWLRAKRTGGNPSKLITLSTGEVIRQADLAKRIGITIPALRYRMKHNKNEATWFVSHHEYRSVL